MNAVTTQQFGPIAKVFQNRPVENNLSAGIQASFPLLGFAGKAWQIRYRGEKHTLMRADGDGPVNSVELVILKAAGVVSKTFYENSYVDGSIEAPDCFSTNGITPEATSKKRQSASCAVCPHNAWGSRPPLKPGDPPRKGKACADTKRLAVVMLNQLTNGGSEMMGAMLLRVPPASLQEVAMYGVNMTRHGYPEYSIATRVAFDTKEVFPKLLFTAIRPLTEEEGAIVLALRDGEQVDRVLAEATEETAATPVESVPQSPFEQPGKGEQWKMEAGTPGVASSVQQAPVSPQTPTQPVVEKTAPATQTVVETRPASTGQATSPSAPAATQTGAAQVAQNTPAVNTAPESAGSSPVVADTPFINTAGIATTVGTANAPSSKNGASPPDNGASKAPNKSFEDELDDKLAALLPSM